MAVFRRDYNILNDVTLSLAKVDAKRMGTRSIVAFPIASIVEGGVRFPLNPLVRMSVLNKRLGLNLDIWDILGCYTLSHNKDHNTYYLRVRSIDCHLVTGLPDSDKHNDDFLQVGEASRFQRRPNRENTEAIKAVLRYKKRVLVDLEAEAFGSSDALETPLVKAKVKSLMDVKLEVGAFGTHAIAAEPSVSVAARAKKRRRETGKTVVEEAFEDHIEDEAFEKWEPPMLHQGRPISTSDLVVASKDFAFDLTKTLLMLVDMADHNGPRNILVLKGTLQMMTVRMHLSITRAEILEKAVLEAAMNVERLTVSLEAEKEGRRTAEREAFRLSKVVALAEKSKEAAIGAGVAYKEEVLVLRDKLFLKGWSSALAAAQVPEGSPLFQDVPVPSRSLGSKITATPAVLLAEVSPEIDSSNKTQESDVAIETVNVEGGGTLETEAARGVAKEAFPSQEVGAASTFPPQDGLDKIVDVAPEVPSVDER
ncbi:hypothetical protein CsSME_00010781 [Camellia sinensis var. sinensis]